MRYFRIVIVFAAFYCSSCNKYLDVIPDNIPTIDNAFTLRNTAEQYLFTCYSFLPDDADMNVNPALMGADEMWHYSPDVYLPMRIARGNQNKLNPVLNYWSGDSDTKALYRGIRECNIFLDNVGRVPDLDEFERNRWIAEVKFLKAYYHFYLFRMYGPIPLIRKNLPISAGIEEVRPDREPADDVVNYIVELLDEALPDLPDIIQSEQMELGRITKSIDLALKAKLLVTAASPLFNGNPDYSNLRDHKGSLLFNPVADPGKWDRAADACKVAIDFCHSVNIRLYDYNLDPASSTVSPETRTTISIRNSVTKKWNSEIIWANTNSMSSLLQLHAQARLHNGPTALSGGHSDLSPTLKIVEMFYTKNGVPMDEDNDPAFNYSDRYNLRTAGTEYSKFIKAGYTTAMLNFDREPRFYASLGFDGSSWYGQGRLGDTDMWYVEAKLGQPAGRQAVGKYSETGYWPKKLVNVETVHPATAATTSGYVVSQYPWPIIRLADLYLLYAEALNEKGAPYTEVCEYLNPIRARAGLKSVQDSWTAHSINPTKFQSKEGLRQIIHQERTIEMAFEGQRFWDVRRWKTGIKEFNGPVRGWDIGQSDTQLYYRIRTTFTQTFQTRDYFWPIQEQDLIVNKNLLQNLGW